MESIKADQEDTREILRAAKIIREAIVKNNLSIAYVMEALQGLYASQAVDLVEYPEYCEKINQHRDYYKHLWDSPERLS